jgi:thioredoxin reductase (NADPH)
MNIDTIIIGGGPAGMTSALYLLRAGKSVLILEKETFGGQIAESPRLENFPSLKTISGMDFSTHLFDQVTDLGAAFELEDAKSIEKVEGGFKVTTDYGVHEARSVIIASGVKHRSLGNPREAELIGHGLSYCAVCDGAFYKGKDVVLIGDANTALQYAIMLSESCAKVTVCTLFDKFFADDILVKTMKKIPNIAYYHNLSLEEFKGEKELTSCLFVNTKTKEKKEIPCSGAFIAIGQIPDNERFADLVELEKGFIKTDEGMLTKTPGLYAVGDCRVKKIRQVITASSDGAIAAVNLANYLNTL